jgi:hypothetical protein
VLPGLGAALNSDRPVMVHSLEGEARGNRKLRAGAEAQLEDQGH